MTMNLNLRRTFTCWLRRARAEQSAEQQSTKTMAIMAENRMMVEIAVSAERSSSTAIYINTTLHA